MGRVGPVGTIGQVGRGGARIAAALAFGLAVAWPAAADGPESLSARIDALLEAPLAARGIPASPPADDAAFFRRLNLDLTGRIPASDDALDFIDDADPAKRAKAIDRLLAGPAWADHWAETWEIALAGRSAPFGDVVNRLAFRAWMRDAFGQGLAHDAFARALITAPDRGGREAAGYYLGRFRDSPADAAGSVARVFLGLQLQCAQCHNHPYEKWTQGDFWGLAAFFSDGDVRPPDRAEAAPTPPRFPGGGGPAEGEGRRAALARLITAPGNRHFARAAVNRVWRHCFGRGLVEPVDDFREADRGTHPELLDLLAREFADGGWDTRALLRAILNTRAYQRSSAPVPGGRADDAGYGRYRPRPLTPEQLFDSLLRAAGSLTMAREYPASLAAEAKRRMLERFVYLLGDDERQEVTAFEGTVPAALLMINGPFTNSAKFRVRPRPVETMDGLPAPAPAGPTGAAADPGTAMVTTLDALFVVDLRPEDRLENLFAAILSRRPTADEQARYLAHLKRHLSLPLVQREAFKDIAWALLNSAEFRFIH